MVACLTGQWPHAGDFRPQPDDNAVDAIRHAPLIGAYAMRGDVLNPAQPHLSVG